MTTQTVSVEEKVQWANEQVKQHEWNLKYGGKFEQIQAKVKLEKIRSLTPEEYEEAAIASYDEHQDVIHNRNYQ